MTDSPRLTGAFGAPVPNNDHSLSAGERGPVLLQDFFLVEKLAHFDRERIPERVVHAKGAGAYGYFEVTKELTPYTKANFLSHIGKQTPVFVRFSTVGGEKGSADTERDPRGFAIKFYTEEGNYDLVGNNLPVFFIRDAIKFPDFVHTQKRNPQSNLKDHDMFWDFLSQTPESIQMVTMLFSDRGTPTTYRNMHGFGVHTFKWVNAKGEAFWVKYHLKTESGIQTLTHDEAVRLGGEDPDHATRDLFNHIASGGEAAWQVNVQIIPYEAGLEYQFDIFDPTKVVFYGDYPEIPIGRLVLNRNPENFFAEVEQAAFSPANLVPGIEASPDKLLQGRLFAYPDTQRYRLGVNYDQIPVNCPYSAKVRTGQRDGFMQVNGNGGPTPNYVPNTMDGTHVSPEQAEHALLVQGETRRTEYPQPKSDDHYEQARRLFEILKPDERANLVSNIVGHLRFAKREIQLRQLCHFYRVHPDYGTQVAQGLGLDIEKELAGLQAAGVAGH